MAFICRAAARLSAALVLMIGIAAPAGVSAETIAMIGTGEVSSALGPRLASLGHEIVYGSRSPEREDVQALVSATGTRALVMSRGSCPAMACSMSAQSFVFQAIGPTQSKE